MAWEWVCFYWDRVRSLPYFAKNRKQLHPPKHSTRHYCLDRSPQEFFNLLIWAVVRLDSFCSYRTVMERILSTDGKQDREWKGEWSKNKGSSLVIVLLEKRYMYLKYSWGGAYIYLVLNPLVKLLCILELQTAGQAPSNVFAILGNDNISIIIYMLLFIRFIRKDTKPH